MFESWRQPLNLLSDVRGYSTFTVFFQEAKPGWDPGQAKVCLGKKKTAQSGTPQTHTQQSPGWNRKSLFHTSKSCVSQQPEVMCYWYGTNQHRPACISHWLASEPEATESSLNTGYVTESTPKISAHTVISQRLSEALSHSVMAVCWQNTGLRHS